VRVAVLDDGAGIPTELVERVWLPDVTTKRRGTGLGLPLVRQAVEAHGGSVHASNRPEGGACFVLILPVGVDGEALRAHEG
jgi:signal transduction histidine kinase